MKDLHSHLLYGIDDGSKSLEESITLLKELEKAGVTELIITPHYIDESKYNCNNKEKDKLFKELKEAAEKEYIEIKLYLGNEIFFTNKMVELLEKEEMKSLNGGKYILFEFPMNHIYSNTLEIINEVVSHGYIPILAHPERYRAFQEKPDKVKEYIKAGVFLQGNCTSLFGKYGRKAKKTLKYYLKNNWISFLGSDTHHYVDFDTEKLEHKLLKITKNEKYTKDILENNFDKVINNEDMGMLQIR